MIENMLKFQIAHTMYSKAVVLFFFKRILKIIYQQKNLLHNKKYSRSLQHHNIDLQIFYQQLNLSALLAKFLIMSIAIGSWGTRIRLHVIPAKNKSTATIYMLWIQKSGRKIAVTIIPKNIRYSLRDGNLSESFPSKYELEKKIWRLIEFLFTILHLLII